MTGGVERRFEVPRDAAKPDGTVLGTVGGAIIHPQRRRLDAFAFAGEGVHARGKHTRGEERPLQRHRLDVGELETKQIEELFPLK